MKTIFTLFLMLCIVQSVFMQESVYPIQPYTKLTKVAVDGKHIYAIGTCNTAMISGDGGNSWDHIYYPLSFTQDVKIIPGSNGQKALFMSLYEIQLFDKQTESYDIVSNDNLISMHKKFRALFIVENEIFIVDDSGIFKAEVGDYNWEKTIDLELSDFEEITKADITDSKIWIGSSFGIIYKIDLESNKITELDDLGNRILHLEMVSDKIGYFVAHGSGDLIKTIDSGESFFPLPNMPESTSPVALGKDILMTINANRIFVSTDGGSSSILYPLPADQMTDLVYGYSLENDSTLFLVGESGMILKSDDLCNSFVHLNPIYREHLTSISFNAEGEGYAVGGNQSILHTTDRGENWEFADFNHDGSKLLNDILAIDEGRFLMAISSGIVIIENNKAVDTIITPAYKIFKAANGEDIYAVRRNGEYKLSKSTDRGDTWTDIGELTAIPRFLFQTSNGNFFSNNTIGQMIISEDEGITWEPLPLEGIVGNVLYANFLNDDLGLLSTGNSLYLTSDRGQTVQKIASSYNMQNLYMFSEKHFLFTSPANNRTIVYETTDGGMNWEITGNDCVLAYDSWFDGDRSIWFAQLGSRIFKHTILETSGISDINTSTPATIFPNPISVGDDFRIEAGTDILISVEIYNLSGKLIRNISQVPSSGKISTYDLLPGSYFIKTRNQDGDNKTGKLIIL